MFTGEPNVVNSDAAYTAFKDHRRIASGPLHTVALLVKRAIGSGSAAPVLIFDDLTGRQIEVDTRGSDEEVVARLTQRAANHEHLDAGSADVARHRGRGRPKLGVVAREVTLLPRHWDWLATQPGGASVALRKLVEEARRTHAESDRRRNRLERAYHFMSAISGDMPGFEEAARALFAADERRFRKLITGWPDDIRDYATALAFGDSQT